MALDKILFVFPLLLLLAPACFPQTVKKALSAKVEHSTLEQPGKSSLAYAEILLRKTELQADVESLVLEYTEEYPKVVEIRYLISALQKESERILAVRPAESSKLTWALGKLLVRKAELETDLWQLLRIYKEDHPDAKRAKRKVDIYEAAIKEILG